MHDLAELESRIAGFADRMRSLQAGRDRRFGLALEMLARIEQRVHDQHVALDQAHQRMARLEKERDAAIARAGELIELYEASVSNVDAFFGGLEALAHRVVGDRPSKPGPQQAPTDARKVPEARSPAPSPRPVTSGLVHAPSKTPFLGELGSARLQPRHHGEPRSHAAAAAEPPRPKSG